MQLHLMGERCTICSSRSRRPVRKLLDIPSYVYPQTHRQVVMTPLTKPVSLFVIHSDDTLRCHVLFSVEKVSLNRIFIYKSLQFPVRTAPLSAPAVHFPVVSSFNIVLSVTRGLWAYSGECDTL